MFGATGDLARRKLIPGLYQLYKRKELPNLFNVIGFSRTKLTDEEFQNYVAEITGSQDFAKLFHYRAGLFEDLGGYNDLAALLGRQDKEWRTCANKLFHLAVPPHYYPDILKNLDESGLTEPCGPEEGWTRVIVEKPFGKDLNTAQELDAMLGDLFQEEQVFRIDHYLGKETARNILAFRFSNVIFAPAWDNRSIASIHVHFPEKVDVDGRGGFYDGVGALRDVGQNHMLQLLALFLMENPGDFTAASIRRERSRVLEALEVMDSQDITLRTARGQYEGYTNIDKVMADSKTETYFRIETHVNLPKWQGVPIYLEHGKAMSESKSEIIVQFRHQIPCLCPPLDEARGEPRKHYTNELRYRVQPEEGIFTSFWVKRPGAGMEIEQKDFSFDYQGAFDKQEFLDAYEKLILDAIKGDQTLFVSTDEILASWRFIDPIIRAWQKDAVPLTMYTPGISRREMAESVKHMQPVPKHIGYIGLGKMGSNMVERLLEFNWEVTAHDPNTSALEIVQKKGAHAEKSPAEVVQALRSVQYSEQARSHPSQSILVWIMVPHKVVDDVLQEISPHLKEGDIVIDGGNSFYKDSVRRAGEMEKQGVHYLDIGVSGGPEGARHGACLMVGGTREVYKQLMGLFNDLAAAGGYDYMGASGSGHFVKMVHNGIEYGMMQAIGEGFAVLREWTNKPTESAQDQIKSGKFDLKRVANLFNHSSVIESRLVGWLKDSYEQFGADLDKVSGSVSHSGEGKWTVEAASELGIPVPIIEGALQFRVDSEDNPSYTGKIVSALRNQFGGHDVTGK